MGLVLILGFVNNRGSPLLKSLNQGQDTINGQRSRIFNPVMLTHYSSLLLGLAVLLYIGRDQWFWYDDWSVLHADLSGKTLFKGHSGHGNTFAALVFYALRQTIGLNNYLPYLTLAIIAHLLVVHLLWRIMKLTGVQPWLATGVAVVLIMIGIAENQLWAFQVGYLGAIAIGLGVILLVNRTYLSRTVIAVIITLSFIAPTFSGTSISVLSAAAVLNLIRRGWLSTLGLFVPVGVTYSLWYLFISGGVPVTLALHDFDLLTRGPIFFGAITSYAFSNFLGSVWLGLLAVLGILIWTVCRFRYLRGIEASAFALLFAALSFTLLTVISRGAAEISTAGAPRYGYVLIMFTAPIMVLILNRFIRYGWIAATMTAVVLIVLGVFNIIQLSDYAGQRAFEGERIHREVSAAYDLVLNDSTITNKWAPVSSGAPDLKVADLRDMAAHGLFTPIAYTEKDKDVVLGWLRIK